MTRGGIRAYGTDRSHGASRDAVHGRRFIGCDARGGGAAEGDGWEPGAPPRRRLTHRTASTEALADLRDVLGALRDPGSAPAESALAPVVRDVRELVDEARTAGQHVGLTVHGLPERVPTTHRPAVYRVVREALTNARKHADGAAVTVRVDYRPPATLVEVTNPPGQARAGPAGPGFGLVGLRERATALGGHLNAGPAGAGAWRPAARIPHPTDTEQNGPRT